MKPDGKLTTLLSLGYLNPRYIVLHAVIRRWVIDGDLVIVEFGGGTEQCNGTMELFQLRWKLF